MFGESDYGEQQFAGTGANNVFTAVFNEVVTMSDTLLKAVSKSLTELVTLTEIFIAARLVTFNEALMMSDWFRKLKNGVSVVWSKDAKSTASWTKQTKTTDDWAKIRKQ